MSTAIALDAAWIFAAVLVVIVFGATGLAIRRMLLDRGGGTVECGLRRPGGTWRLGVAAYEEDELRWYDAVGVLLTPEGGWAGGPCRAGPRAGGSRPGAGVRGRGTSGRPG